MSLHLRPIIHGPRNVETDLFSFLLLWADCFIFNPLRWLRFAFFRSDSRAPAVAQDVLDSIRKSDTSFTLKPRARRVLGADAPTRAKSEPKGPTGAAGSAPSATER